MCVLLVHGYEHGSGLGRRRSVTVRSHRDDRIASEDPRVLRQQIYKVARADEGGEGVVGGADWNQSCVCSSDEDGGQLRVEKPVAGDDFAFFDKAGDATPDDVVRSDLIARRQMVGHLGDADVIGDEGVSRAEIANRDKCGRRRWTVLLGGGQYHR